MTFARRKASDEKHAAILDLREGAHLPAANDDMDAPAVRVEGSGTDGREPWSLAPVWRRHVLPRVTDHRPQKPARHLPGCQLAAGARTPTTNGPRACG